MKHNKIYLIIVLIVVAFFCFLGFSYKSNKLIEVKTSFSSKGSIQKYINLMGEVNSNNIDRFSFSDGRPRKINVKVGQSISKGDIIATSTAGNTTANINGIVTKVDENSSAFGGMPIGTVVIQDINDLKIIVELNKNDYKEVEVGQRVLITDNDGEVVAGEVVFISPTAERKNTMTDTESYVKVDIKILSNLDKFTIGFNNELDILVKEINDVITVPIEAIIRESGNNTFVYTVDNDIVQKKNVVVGIEGDHTIEIKEGILEEEEVILNPINTLKDGEKVHRRS